MKRLLLVLILAPAVAHAGALGRPNIIDARSTGMGGAFTAVADDPSAIWFNPAGLAQIRETTLLGGVDFVSFTFNDTPAVCGTSTTCPKISESNAQPLPALAFSTRFAGANGRDPSRFAVGFGAFVTMGGQADFNQTQLTEAHENPGIIHSRVALLELTPSIAYKVNEVLSVGASLRAGVMGMGVTDFETLTDTRPSNANLSGSGAGFGYSVGLLVKPLPELALGATYRSRLDASISGNGTINNGSTTQQVGFDLTIPWPQSFSFGFAYRIIPQLRVMGAVDWTDWSSFDAIAPRFSDANLDALGRLLLDYTDNYTFHVGAEYLIGERGALRAGYSYDTNSIPDRTLDRQLLDGPKYTIDGGIGYRVLDRLWLDGAGEILLTPTRTVAVSDMTVPKYLRNVSPGTYEADVVSFQLTARYTF